MKPHIDFAQDIDKTALLAKSINWHKTARFGCLIHWGVYSEHGGVWGDIENRAPEHLMRWAKITRSDYLEKVVKPFNPVDFDADLWAETLVNAGFRYVIVTAKHHDGLAMYPSKVSAFNITLTKYSRDPLQELGIAFRKYGLMFGIYYSQAVDWEYKDAPGNNWEYGNPGKGYWWRQDATFLDRARRYMEDKAIPQVIELVKNYDPDLFWFDTDYYLPIAENARILEEIRKLNDKVIINGRLAKGFGDYKNSHNQQIEFPFRNEHWEGIQTTNESFGWSSIDNKYKTSEYLIELLAKSVSRGGNMLLNLGPCRGGYFDTKDLVILKNIGKWMTINSESIYGCGPAGASSHIVTGSDSHAYMHVREWPKTNILKFAGMLDSRLGEEVILLNDNTPCGVKKISRYYYELSSKQPPNCRSNVVVKLPTLADMGAIRFILPDQPSTLHVMDASLVGRGIYYFSGAEHKDTVASWTGHDSYVHWVVNIIDSGYYDLEIIYSTDVPGGGEFCLDCSVDIFCMPVVPTKSITSFNKIFVGSVWLPCSTFDIIIRPTRIIGKGLMRLKSLILTPTIKS